MLCQVFPEQYQAQLEQKQQRLQRLLGELPQFSCFPSSPEHYRQRAEFRVWHEGDALDYIMFDPESKQRVKIVDCPMADRKISQLMPQLLNAIKAVPVLREKLFQIDFLTTLSGEMLVTLIYKKPIAENEAWQAAANGLRERLPITHIIGRARKQKVVLDHDYVIEQLQVDGQTFIYQQVENSFTQPNAVMAQNMLHWARKVTRDSAGDLIELYCGNGHFSIALAENFQRVLATEISKTSVHSAQFNLQANQVENVTIIKMAAEEVSQALQGKPFKRLQQQGIQLADYDFSTILVDPPRAGLDALTRQMAAEFAQIVYISCNPETLQRDLQVLTQTHKVVETALFDQFPYTHHIESGVFLQRKSA
ncbi:tRNA (uridine(54)-C5)-methyltransferase TrmA [Galenea microaerophila]